MYFVLNLQQYHGNLRGPGGPLNAVPRKLGLNKALLRETNG